MPKYLVDIATSYFSGRTFEIEADDAQSAYEQVVSNLKENEKVIQMRSEWNEILYSEWQEQGFIVKIKGK